MRKAFFLIFIIFAAASSSHAQANIWCDGHILRTYIDHKGNLYVYGSWRKNYTRLCNLKDDAIQCHMWASYAAIAVKDKLRVVVMYAGNSYTCSSLPTYLSSPRPVYLMLKNEE